MRGVFSQIQKPSSKHISHGMRVFCSMGRLLSQSLEPMNEEIAIERDPFRQTIQKEAFEHGNTVIQSHFMETPSHQETMELPSPAPVSTLVVSRLLAMAPLGSIFPPRQGTGLHESRHWSHELRHTSVTSPPVRQRDPTPPTEPFEREFLRSPVSSSSSRSLTPHRRRRGCGERRR